MIATISEAPPMSDLDRAFDIVMDIEGGGMLHKVSGDPGGLTKWGISQRAYPDLDIANLTREAALAVYRRDYWLACNCDKLAWPVALAVFDCAVNQGQARARKWLQRSIGAKADGIIGPLTMRRLDDYPPDLFLTWFLARRALGYALTGNLMRFGLGWFRRLFIIHQHALLNKPKESQ
jgi:lysozyme family protein